jgi:hypothetical protein
MKILYNLQLEVYIYNKTVRIMIYYEKNKNINIIANHNNMKPLFWPTANVMIMHYL